MIQFAQLDANTRNLLANGAYTLDSATLELWNSAAGWNSTTLNFSRLLDANAGWAALSGPDDGTAGINSWNNINETDGTDWAGSTGAGNNSIGSAGQEIFGMLTSEHDGNSALGALKFEVPLAGSELLDWLTSDTIAPNLLASWDSGAGDASAAQTRFATINSADTADEFAPNLVLEITIPEPSSMMLALVGLFAAGRRRVG